MVRHPVRSDRLAHVMRTCGCDNDEGHVESYVDPILHLRHGERAFDDPQPHAVPGSETRYNGWVGLPDAYCLCGHPNYSTCQELDGGGMLGMTLHNVGGHFISTLDDDV